MRTGSLKTPQPGAEPPSFLLNAPQLSLPKGGGAIRGIGEKFTASAATGTGALSVPLPLSPGRGGFQPQLAIQYDSGTGNGPFGIGWSLSIAAIARKTDKGLPRYLDAQQSDVFVLAGAQDLVPCGDADTARYRIRRYRPRIEGLFALIERWSARADPADVFWRVLDRSNVTQWFGRTPASRIADPGDASRIFQWLLCESHDDKGNAIIYDYLADGAQRYLERVRYGNRTPYMPVQLFDPMPAEWLFELAFEYGGRARPDAFSSHRAGFEVRTTRRCERALMLHHMGEPVVGLVRSMRFRYGDVGARDPLAVGYSMLAAVESWGHEGDASRQLPPLEFDYSRARPDAAVRTVAAADLAGLPVGTQGPGCQWVDLDGEGLSGVLTEEAGSWRYAANLGEGRFAPSREVVNVPARRALNGGQRLIDLNGNGQLDVVEFDGPMPGFHERDARDGWRQFIPFAALPQVRWDDPNLRFVDLTGDGHADALITEDEVFTWYPSQAESGFGSAESARPPPGEEGVRMVFSDGAQTLLLADMCGDGLTDMVRIRNGEVCYWPNLGYGKFGRKVALANAPRFDHDELFDPRRIRLADIDGSGPTDILYLGREGAQLYFNRSGNALSDVLSIAFPLATLNLAAVQVVDLLGRGTACLVWNSHLPAESDAPVRYIDLMGGVKPHLLIESRNNLGASTRIDYTPSTHFYLADQAAGTPWVTRLPFPVQCVSRVTVSDAWRGTAFSSTYSYHHGYFDGIEREFRGFGRVEQTDVEDYGRFEQANSGSPWITEDQRLFQPPVKTVTWYHTGGERARIEHEYFAARYAIEGGFAERVLPGPELDPSIGVDERREALRACKGMVLRQEVYELAIEDAMPVRLYSAATHNCRITQVQSRGTSRHAVFLVTESEALTYQYELALPAPGAMVGPDPRVSHALTLRVDEYGQALQTVVVGYPRSGSFDDVDLQASDLERIRAVQGESHLAYAETRFTADVLLPGGGGPARHHRLRLPCEQRSFELTGIARAGRFYFEPADFAALRLSDFYPPLDGDAGPVDVGVLPYHRSGHGAAPQARLVEHRRTRYFDDADDTVAPSDALPWGQHGPRGLRFEQYQLALTRELLDAVFRSPATLSAMPADMLDWELHAGVSARSLLDDARRSGYLHGETVAADAAPGQYWLHSGSAGFAADATRHFFLPERFTNAFGAVTSVEYDALDMYARSVTDARTNRSEVLRFDHRVLMPVELVDINGNHTEVSVDILGMVVAVAAKGKRAGSGWQGDDVDAFHADPALRNPGTAGVQAFCSADILPEEQARSWLARAGSRFIYHFGEQVADDGSLAWASRPAMACSIARAVHAADPGGDSSALQVSLKCSDGGGNVLMAKQQAEPETAGGPLRWIVNGLTVLNNKGKPVKQYAPFFSDRFGCELPVGEGVATVLFYDAAGRPVRTDLPDLTFSRVAFSPWLIRHFDTSDTVLDSGWYAERLGAGASAADRHAARLSALHADTPGTKVLDSLGREVITMVHNRSPSDDPGYSNTALFERPWLDQQSVTHTRLDAEGKPLWVRDARANLVMQYIHPPKPAGDAGDFVPSDSVPAYDIAGALLYQHSMDAGGRWMLGDAAGQPLLAWDVNSRLDDAGQPHAQARLSHTEYDALHRPLCQWLRLDSAGAAAVERFDYRDTADAEAADACARNLIGHAVRHDDPGGRTELLRLNFSGQVLHERRRLGRHSDAAVIDWQGDDGARDALLETEHFTRHTEYDALGRMTQLINWHRSAASVAVYRPLYNARGLLHAEDLSIGASLVDGRPSGGRRHLRAIDGITYNAQGQRLRLCHGNLTETLYAYDERSFRLAQLRTTRPPTALPFPGFHANLENAQVVQQLHYTYDAAGKITEIHDEAWAPVYFRNQAVTSRSCFVYDAQQRLIEATGRESGRASGAPGPLSEPVGVDAFPDVHALRDYRQRYYFDAVGNLAQMRHIALDGNWTRHYHTASDSNRLLRTWTGSVEIDAVNYAHDTHGSLLNLANVADPARIRWDWRDMIGSTDLVGGGRAWYAYDIGKQRTRKRIERLGGVVEERCDLGGMELYRRYAPSGAVLEEIETHLLFVDEQCVLMVDDVRVTDNARLGTGVLERHQYGNHLGSVVLELDARAHIIGCEEFHPFGTSAIHLSAREVRATAKRYRYAGMESDAETGMSYHGARHYVPWLGRWSSADKMSLVDGLNLYCMTRNDPVNRIDPGGQQSHPVPATFAFVEPEQIRARALAIAAAELPGYSIDAHDRRGHLLPASFSDVWGGRASGVVALLHDPENAEFTLGRLREVAATPGASAHFDPYLSIAVAARESGGVSFRPSTDRTLYHTYYSGGLDNVGAAMASGRLTDTHVPADALARWRASTEGSRPTAVRYGDRRSFPLVGLNERGKQRHSAGLRLSDFLVAYAGYLNAQWDDQRVGIEQQSLSFLGTVGSYGFTQEAAAALSPLAQRIWQALFFGGPGGAAYGEDGSFGARTILSFLQAGGHQLSDITRLAELPGGAALVAQRRTRSAFTVALIAEAMEREVVAAEAQWQGLVEELNRDFATR